MKFLNSIDGASRVIQDSNNRFLTDTEKTKLTNISTGANKALDSTTNGNILIDGVETNIYTHPTTTGNKHVPSGGSSGQILRWSSDGTAVWGTDNNTTYSVATTSVNGLMSSTDKTKIDSVASNSNNSLVSTTQPTTQIIGDMWFVETVR